MSSDQRIKCKKVAVVLLGYNSRDYLDKFIPSVLLTDYEDYDLVYVDNASTDDSISLVETKFPSVKIFRIHENHGFTGGYTESLPNIDAEYYVLLNSDVEVKPDWLSVQMARMEADPQLGATQPKLLHYNTPEQFDYAGACGGFIDKYGYPFCRGRIFHKIEKDEGQYDSVLPIFWASGACMLVRAELYHSLGGLDNDFFAHMEEIDLCWRIHNAGYRIEVVPQAVVYHVGGSIISYGSFEKIYHNFRNNLIMMFKNLESADLIPRFGMRLALDFVAALRALFIGSFTEFRAIIWADIKFFIQLRKWIIKRKKAQLQVSTNPNREGVFPKSMVYRFFIKGRHKFSQITFK